MCVCVKRDHVSPPRSNRRLRLVHVPPTEASNGSLADASTPSGAAIKNKQDGDGQCEGPMRAGTRSAAILPANSFVLFSI